MHWSRAAKDAEYFDDIPNEKVPKDMLELATHIVSTKKGHFDPAKFKDRYEDALKDLLKKKQSGEKIEAPTEREPAKVINLLDALRRSIERKRGRPAPKPPRHAIARRRRPPDRARGARKRAERQRPRMCGRLTSRDLAGARSVCGRCSAGARMELKPAP